MKIKTVVILFSLLIFCQLKVNAEIITNKKGTSYLEASLSVVKQEKDSILEKKYNTAKELYGKKEYAESLKLALILLDELKNKNNKYIEYLCNFLIGDSFNKMNKHTKSLFYFKQSLDVISEINKTTIDNNDRSFNTEKVIAKNSLKIGAGYLRLSEKDSAKYYFNKIISINSFDNELLDVKASAYNNLSGIYSQDSLYDKAREFSLKAIEIRKRTKNKLFEASALGNLASIYAFEENYRKSKEIYLEALNLIENDNSSTAFRYKKDLYLNLAWALYNLKDYTAYDYQEKSYDIKDSLRDAEVQFIVKDVFAKHQENLQKEKTNLVKQQVALKKAEERKTNWFLGALMLLTLGISGTILYNYKLRQNNLKLKLTQTELSQKNKLEKLKTDSQIRVLNATIDGKETERKQIAETLHDSVSSLLSSANLHLQATKMQFNGDTPIEIAKTQKIIIEASQTIRDLSHTLVSSVLLKFGLNYAIKDMAEKYSNSQITMETEVLNVGRFHQSFEIKVYNIVHELVNNILKHSNAKRAIVRMKDVGNLLTIEIQDNGDGFDKKVIPEKDGLGINQIDARIQMMKGTFVIDSILNKGTKISVTLPVFEKDAIVNA